MNNTDIMYFATVKYTDTHQAISWCQDVFGYDELAITHAIKIKVSKKTDRWNFVGRSLLSDEYSFVFCNETDRNWFLLRWT